MNARLKTSLVLTSVLACSFAGLPASAVSEPSPRPVFELINERLEPMKSVALYKAQNSLAVEDKAREKVVIDAAKAAASAAGLDPESVASFYQVQIQAAKAIQYRYLADWTLDAEAMNQPAADLDTQIRPRLIELGNELTAAMKGFLEARGCFRPSHLPLFMESITVEHLTEAEKIRIFESMSKIDLSHSVAHCGVVN